MRQRIGIASLLAVIIMIGVMGASAAPVAADGAFSDDNGQFTFAIPDGWEQKTTKAKDVVAEFDSTDPLGSFTVALMPAPEDATLDDVMPGLIAKRQARYQSVIAVGTHPVTLAGEDGAQVDFTAISKGFALTVSEIYAIHNGTIYVVTIATQPRDAGVFMGQASYALGSWQFTDAQE